MGVEERRVVIGREVAAGVVLIVVAEFLGAALSTGHAGDALLVAVACGLAAALATDWVSWVCVGVLAAVILVAFASYRFGTSSWPYTPIIGFAVMTGAGFRTLRRLESMRE
ncbi:hypothetical protein [Actinoplanes sp. NPDC026619]|uniref:hypothetical protein n=1 Tax=Actinoplanes sp. NPDC026619 TaxID=3155798 RepID=UPI0033FFDFD4